ncbi:FliI/YscN family ATPase [Palleronia abyssalis]|uniref:Flagellum-specific ATP synthase n=1 Tax=Palleronia abyssalis TaxID=1501240 RepID=A0A2R8BWV6_9RHOB|nr:FliI/YscN family ATPase [Palleronia abyssalis]SPJ24635.1 Flagellum-specific ATP synthase [Palleronia abyssalis]
MSLSSFENVTAALADIRLERPMGVILAFEGPVVRIGGLSGSTAVGHRVRLGHSGRRVAGEILGGDSDSLVVMPDGPVTGLCPGDPVVSIGVREIAPDSGWLGRVIDPDGRPIDGRQLLPGHTQRPLTCNAPDPVNRRGFGKRLETGLRALNTVLPIVRGQRVGLFAGSGVGKSTLLGALTRRMEADVIVIAMVGERGREVRDFIERILGPEGLARSVIVAATSDAPASVRARCLPAAITVAEHFRDEGRQVLLLGDSITRHAEAHRQVAAARGEAMALGGYPASMAAEIASLVERTGPGEDEKGDITAVLTVLVAGSDMESPVADVLRGLLDGHIVLDRTIAERGRFPAIDLSRSVSRSLPDAASDQENALIGEARRLIGAYERSEMMIQAGLYAAGNDRTLDAAVQAWPKLDAFLGQSEAGTSHESFVALARCLSRRQEGS